MKQENRISKEGGQGSPKHAKLLFKDKRKRKKEKRWEKKGKKLKKKGTRAHSDFFFLLSLLCCFCAACPVRCAQARNLSRSTPFSLCHFLSSGVVFCQMLSVNDVFLSKKALLLLLLFCVCVSLSLSLSVSPSPSLSLPVSLTLSLSPHISLSLQRSMSLYCSRSLNSRRKRGGSPGPAAPKKITKIKKEKA